MIPIALVIWLRAQGLVPYAFGPSEYHPKCVTKHDIDFENLRYEDG
jgi:hypothetical protein